MIEITQLYKQYGKNKGFRQLFVFDGIDAKKQEAEFHNSTFGAMLHYHRISEPCTDTCKWSPPKD